MSLRYALLGLLTAEPMNGYSIKALFNEAIDFIWQAELSQIYRELGLLQKEGLVNSMIEPQSDRPNKRIYSITAAGRDAFSSWLLSVPETLAMPKRDELMLRMFFGSVAGEKVVREELERYLSQMRMLRETFLQPTHIAERYPNNPLMARADRACREDRYCGFIRKRALMTSETAIRWAESCLAEMSTGSAPDEKNNQKES
jgi:DNA-binding PadR family transcriptional regulator